MDIQFGNLANLHLLWIVAALLGLMCVAAVLRRRALQRFATANLVRQLTSRISGPRRVLKSVLVVTSLALLAVALTDPRWGRTWREVPQKGIDVMFAVDVSRSMLAEDASPTRLERARQQIGDMLDAMHGDRVGLVAFAGDVKQLSPLTTNYHDFKQTLETVGPHSVPRGGSKLGEALRIAARGFLDQTDDHKAIVVFTDGDDQDSDPVAVAKELYLERGIRVFTVGLGDAEQGARIPVSRSRNGTQWLEHNGEQIWSVMNGTVLQQVAAAADGAWIPAGTKQVDMAGVYRTYIASIEQMDFETARIHSYLPRHQWLIGLALLLLVLESLISDRRKASSISNSQQVVDTQESVAPANARRRRTSTRRGELVASALLLCVFSLGATSPVAAEDASTLIAKANAALASGEYQSAIADYRQAAQLQPDRWEPVYNEAVAHYRDGDLKSARQLFTQVLAAGDRQLEAQARFNLGNCDYADAVAMTEQDREAAISRLESAISHYRETLALSDGDTDARINTDLASRLIEQLRQETEQEEQDPQEQDQQQQQSEQNQDSQQDESAEQNESSQQNPESQQKDQTQPEQDSQPDDASHDQSSEAQDQDASEDPSAQDPSGQQEEHEPSQDDSQDESDRGEQRQTPSDRDGEDQQDAEAQADADPSETEREQDDPQQSDAGEQHPQESEPQPDQSPPGDQQPQEQTETRPGQASFDHPQSSEPPASGAPQYGQSTAADPEAQPMTELEAEKMLQAVRDRDLRRRLEHLREERRRFVPVDKDW